MMPVLLAIYAAGVALHLWRYNYVPELLWRFLAAAGWPIVVPLVWWINREYGE